MAARAGDAGLTAPTRAFRLGKAVAVVTEAGPEDLVLRALVVPEARQRRGEGRVDGSVEPPELADDRERLLSEGLHGVGLGSGLHRDAELPEASEFDADRESLAIGELNLPVAAIQPCSVRPQLAEQQRALRHVQPIIFRGSADDGAGLVGAIGVALPHVSPYRLMGVDDHPPTVIDAQAQLLLHGGDGLFWAHLGFRERGGGGGAGGGRAQAGGGGGGLQGAGLRLGCFHGRVFLHRVFRAGRWPGEGREHEGYRAKEHEPATGERHAPPGKSAWTHGGHGGGGRRGRG